MFVARNILLLLFLPLALQAQTKVIQNANKQNHDLLLTSSAYYYVIPNDKNITNIIGSADSKALHYEVRYNYEDINTGSLFAGYRFEHNGELQFSFIPMIGFAFGRTNGLAPGLEMDVSYSLFNLYSENEYMLDFKGNEDFFFYSWTQLGFNATKNLNLGVITQNQRWYKTQFDIQRGVFAEYTIKNLELSAYYFNMFSSYNFLVGAVLIEF